jgi:hypothetical protein
MKALNKLFLSRLSKRKSLKMIQSHLQSNRALRIKLTTLSAGMKEAVHLIIRQQSKDIKRSILRLA